MPVYALLRASILDFKARLGNRCRVLPVYALLRASILDFKPKLGNRCSVLAAAVRNGPPTVVVAATRSVSDSILRCREEERFRLQRSWRQRDLRPILIFVAAKENGFAGSGRSGRALSVAANWAGAAHPRRQKHREMPPPGASAPAFAATAEPTSTLITSDLPPERLI